MASWSGYWEALLRFSLSGSSKQIFEWEIFSPVGMGRDCTPSPKKGGKETKLAAFFRPLFWERAGFALLGGLLLGLLVQVLVGPVYAVIDGLFITAFLVVLGNWREQFDQWKILFGPGKAFGKNAVPSLLIGLGYGTFGGIFDAYPYFQQRSVFLTTLSFWLSLGATLGIIVVLM